MGGVGVGSNESVGKSQYAHTERRAREERRAKLLHGFACLICWCRRVTETGNLWLAVPQNGLSCHKWNSTRGCHLSTDDSLFVVICCIYRKLKNCCWLCPPLVSLFHYLCERVLPRWARGSTPFIWEAPAPAKTEFILWRPRNLPLLGPPCTVYLCCVSWRTFAGWGQGNWVNWELLASPPS